MNSSDFEVRDLSGNVIGTVIGSGGGSGCMVLVGLPILMALCIISALPDSTAVGLFVSLITAAPIELLLLLIFVANKKPAIKGKNVVIPILAISFFVSLGIAACVGGPYIAAAAMKIFGLSLPEYL